MKDNTSYDQMFNHYRSILKSDLFTSQEVIQLASEVTKRRLIEELDENSHQSVGGQDEC